MSSLITFDITASVFHESVLPIGLNNFNEHFVHNIMFAFINNKPLAVMPKTLSARIILLIIMSLILSNWFGEKVISAPRNIFF